MSHQKTYRHLIESPHRGNSNKYKQRYDFMYKCGKLSLNGLNTMYSLSGRLALCIILGTYLLFHLQFAATFIKMYKKIDHCNNQICQFYPRHKNSHETMFHVHLLLGFFISLILNIHSLSICQGLIEYLNICYLHPSLYYKLVRFH